MNFKRFLVVSGLLLVLASGAYAQDDDRNAVFVASMNSLTYTPKQESSKVGAVIGEIAAAVLSGTSSRQQPAYESAVRAAIVRGMSDSFRLRAVDGPLTEEEKNSPYAFYVDATVSNISSSTKTETQTYEEKGEKKTRTRTYYRGEIGVTLLVKNAADDAVVGSPAFNISAYDSSWFETVEGAMNSALKTLSRDVCRYFDAMLPLTGALLELNGKEAYIDLGFSHGIGKGQVLDVFSIREIAGKTARKQIAKLKVKSVEGDEISLCKVSAGAKDLQAAVAAGAEIVIVTK